MWDFVAEAAINVSSAEVVFSGKYRKCHELSGWQYFLQPTYDYEFTLLGQKMMTLLLLNDDTRNKNEICDFFSSAGYQINWSDTSATFLARQSLRKHNKSITILQIDRTHPFPSDIASVAQSLAAAWRLSMHERTLTAPNNNKIKLTSLEFTLIKTFALLEIGEVASRKKIIDEFGEHYLSYDQNRLDTMIMRLRKKIRHGLGLALPLNTVRVRGFSFDDLLILDH